MSARSGWGVAVAVVGLVSSLAARAETPQGLQRDQFQTPPVLGLTVSGGVSLGAFEAGYLYYLFETLKLNPGLVEPRIFTGASAGSVNALLSLMASCAPPQKQPDKSLFHCRGAFLKQAPPVLAGLAPARRGFALSSQDNFAGVACTELPCSRAFFEVYGSFTFFQLIQAHIGLAVSPPMRGLDWSFGLTPQFGVEFDRP